MNPVPYFADDRVTIHHGDNREVLKHMDADSVDACVTDPPYGLEFMGKGWDAPWQESGINTDAGFHGGGMNATKNAPSFTSSTNPNCLNCGGKQRGRRDGTAIVAVCVCSKPMFPNTRATEMRAFQSWCAEWATECLRVLKPGAYLLAFGGTRTWHRLACAIEDVGFEVRDSIAWMYGSGFPKSMNVAKAIHATEVHGGANSVKIRQSVMGDEYRPSGKQGNRDGLGGSKMAGDGYGDPDYTPAAQEWEGWGTALKPAFEPIVVARKPLTGTVADNVQQWRTGALNIDGCRIRHAGNIENADGGRWPANVILDESQAAELDRQSGVRTSRIGKPRGAESGEGWGMTKTGAEYDDSGGASRFFYTAKANSNERPRIDGIAHPTVKPLELMRYLVRLVTPPGATVLDPFAGSGATAEACIMENRRCITIEITEDYLPLITQRVTRQHQLPLI